jgi:hypothetical protein
MTKFHANLIEAERVEHAGIKLMQSRGHQAWKNTLDQNWGDYWVRVDEGKPILVEHKTDYESLYTRNVCVEPDTLNYTRSQYFLYVLPEAYIIPTPQLKMLYREWKDFGKQGGDQGRQLALIPKDTFLSYDFVKRL